MPIQDYSTDPDLNVQISGINIAEGCPPSGINNAIRQLMADVKEESEAKAEAIAAAATQASSALEAYAEGQAAKDAAQDAAIAAAQSSADAAQSSADAAQSSADAAQNSVPTGTVIAFAANSEPPGSYLLCNGAAVSRTTYAKLFSVISTTYGAGDGSTTFNLPELTDGRFIEGSHHAGDYFSAGLPGMTGTIGTFVGGATGVFDAGIRVGSISVNAGNASTLTHHNKIFNAHLASAIYGASTTVQPSALTMRYYIKY